MGSSAKAMSDDASLGGSTFVTASNAAVLGRLLKPEEAREFMHIARRIAALVVLNEALDENYALSL